MKLIRKKKYSYCNQHTKLSGLHQQESDKEDAKHQIKKISDIIRRKCILLKLNRETNDATLSRMYQPLIHGLQEIANNTKDINQITANEKSLTKTMTPQSIDCEAPVHGSSPNSLESSNEYSSELLPSPPSFNVKSKEENKFESINTNYKSSKEYFDQYPTFAREYIEQYFSDRKHIDKTYGLRYDSRLSKWSMGSKVIDFGEDSSVIVYDENGMHVTTFPASIGFYEFIFKKKPDNYYTLEDREKYKKLLCITNAHRKDYDPDNRVMGNKHYKYNKIIKPLVTEKVVQQAELKVKKDESVSGRGMCDMSYNDKPTEYVYWDDVNELVDRMRLLYASKMAGNNSHDDEIASIVEALKEADVIY